MSAARDNPEIGRTVETGPVLTNYHDVGSGAPVLLLHGSGPGVSAWANWRLLLQNRSPDFRLLAPDLAGFGYSKVPEDIAYTVQAWLDQIVSFMDALGLDRVHVVGNSFGGAMALALAIAHPGRVNRMVLMGSAGVPFKATAGLDAAWGYEPSLENMRAILGLLAYDQSLITDALVKLRYEASIRPGAHEAFSRMFPAPRQRWIDALTHEEKDIRALPHPTLIVHGRDDKVVPLSTSLTLLEWIDNSQLHVFGRCGHWTQIEQAAGFERLVSEFLRERP